MNEQLLSILVYTEEKRRCIFFTFLRDTRYGRQQFLKSRVYIVCVSQWQQFLLVIYTKV